ncbi:MAG: DUF4351 domain-containing protein [Candidatus Viridilinea halotolerans]|uniref:DUF4351 domain-containing protein n=1 Tax=Candidatus Viridilinea halotolerans TaxID=2491704 RepID=A0A426TT05_9CHLR|nr:MAG: DUF4351 domain-containing protein [Candidatus Viridilinea halotolerans]
MWRRGCWNVRYARLRQALATLCRPRRRWIATLSFLSPLKSEMTAQIQALTATQMLDLADALLDFTSRAALEQWLAEQTQSGAGKDA